MPPNKEQYTICVTFTRERADDIDIVGSADKSQLTEQFRKELQTAFDDNIIGGSFVITSVNWQ